MHRLANLTMAATNRTPIVVILGATGAGKSQLALELASKFGGEIISADAMQMYRGLDIVTNKVTPEEQKLVKHHMINILDPLSINNVVDFRNKALPVVEKLLIDGKIPVICGGTNYYIESLLWKVLVDDTLPLIVGQSESPPNKQTSSDELTNSGIHHSYSDIKDKQTNNTVLPLPLSSQCWTSDPGTPDTLELYSLLQSVDPDRASVLHPRERRKIWRSLQVFSQHGIPHSKLLKEQEGNTVGMGGGLRFNVDRICIIEVWSEQKVLEARCDKRVEKMLARGLVKELEQFHLDYNRLRAEKGDIGNLEYEKGIWQSIGFKEFHKYLCLDEKDREGETGKKLFEEGVERMKLSTKQYSRKQSKWIRRRFLLDHRNPPPVYRVDSSDPSQWREKVYNPAELIVQDFIDGKKPSMEPLERVDGGREREEDCRRTIHCDRCNRDFKGSKQYSNHLKSSSHKKVVRALEGCTRYEMVLTEFNAERRDEAALLIKNTLIQPLSEVFTKMGSLPAVLCTVFGKAKAENIAKELLKQGIMIQVKKLSDAPDSS